MQTTRNYGGVIWTNHALERLHQRSIPQDVAYLAFRKADKSRYAQSKGGWVYHKTIQGKLIEVVAKKNEKNQWVILTVWSKLAVQSQRKQHWLLKALRFLFFGA